MTQNDHNMATETVRTESVDHLDRLLSDFFKSQMKTPWPSAPVVNATEPSDLVAARNATSDMYETDPATSPRDGSARARLTLAASVAILLGTCWSLSNGFQPQSRNAVAPGRNASGPSLNDAGAKNPDALLELREDRAKGGNGIVRPKLELP